MQFYEEPWNHIRFCHGIHRTASADQEGVPAGDNTTHTTDDQNLRHDTAVKCFCHRIRSYQTTSCQRGFDIGRVHHITNAKDDQCVEDNCQDNRKNQNLTNLF